MTRQRFLSTFLFAAVLSPVMLYADSCRPPVTATLTALELRVGDFHGENVIEGFTPHVFSYEVMFPEAESVGVLWVRAANPSLAVDVSYDGRPSILAGQTVAKLDVPLGESELRIAVSSRQPPRSSNTYVVRIRRAPVFPCTEEGIRDAIAHGGGPNYFDCDGPTHVPTASEIIIDNDVVLDGNGEMIVDAGGGGADGNGGNGGSPFAPVEMAPKVAGEHRVFSVSEDVTAELIGFTVTGGSTTGEGGGILNAGTFSLTSSQVSENNADVGGGIRNLSSGILFVSGSRIEANAALRYGGGIHNIGRVEVSDSALSANHAGLGAGGADNWEEGVMKLEGSTVSGNSAGQVAGGIGNHGVLTLSNTTVSDNEATARSGGGLRNWNQMTIIDSAVSANVAGEDGGGIRNEDLAILTLTGSTISGNTAMFGAGIRNFGQAEVIDTTVVDNTAGQAGGGFANRPGATLTITGSTVSGNTALTGGSGGIANSGNIWLNSTSVSNNQAGDEGGGMINYAGGTAELIDTTLSLNRSPGNGGGVVNRPGATMTIAGSRANGNQAANNGGGIDNHGFLSLRDSSVWDNSSGSGGGIYVGHSGVLSVLNSSLSGNMSASAGGGIDIDGWVTITKSEISGNTAELGGGALLNQGFLEMNDTSVSNNASTRFAGGIWNMSEATLNSSTVSSNSALEDGGGIRNSETGALILSKCTVAENSAGTWGGGIRNLGAMNILDTTVSDNTGQGLAGLSNRPGAWMALTNSTVSGNGVANWSTLILASVTISAEGILNDGGWIEARNTIVDSGCDATPLINSLGGNVESPGNTCFTPNAADQVSLAPEQLNLGALQDNGGPTWTHALLAGSFAIDAVEECVNWSGFPLFLDQRGAPRPYGPACDSGAFELGAVPLPGDLCTSDPDRVTYESLEYVDAAGNLSTCFDAATAIAADCVFGSPQSSPPLLGCPAEVEAVIGCFPNCSPDVIAALDRCVAECTEGATGLSTDCAGCYGEWAGCGAEVCVPECEGGGLQPQCVDCLFYSGCSGRFDSCSGLPAEVDCGFGPPPPTEACVNDADRAVYESLTYINGQNEFFTCIDAAFEIGNDCVFGSSQSEPPIAGCSGEASQVIGCFPNCPEEVIAAFGACVASCTSEATGLSSTCGNCYGEAAACGAAFCTFSCAGDLNSPSCISCRVENGCIPDFDECSGLPGEVDCSLIPNHCEGVDCDDRNPCTQDRCDFFTGICENTPVPNGSFCDTGEAPGFCTDGECIEDFCWSNPCDDGNQCTWDQCDSLAQICWNDPRPDGSYCFFDGGAGGSGGVPGVCVAGSCAEDRCLGNPCDDGDPCTFDGCNPVDGSCDNEPLPDGAYCSLDNGPGGSGGVPGVCLGGICTEDLCIGNPCQDGNPCTSDQCSLLDGSCTNDPVPDGWFCDAEGVPGYCAAGQCVPEEACEGLDCDDGNPCTFDQCDPGPGVCINDPNPVNGWPCDLLGSGDGICIGGECVEEPGGSGGTHGGGGVGGFGGFEPP